ncbi:hypothetical protein QBC32DRAFT_39670 [Pseudoneurospora amorphoporcata]|uniref:Metallothionein n=1 Tax=Pseudoneurospora amorphoporcata TaxID=241081 RepID=A0AAN6P4G2_9PEZI|nr:hypothetical protein QBC32DRAFT_39670 [Pseudoneurospora amorphoporcata]
MSDMDSKKANTKADTSSGSGTGTNKGPSTGASSDTSNKPSTQATQTCNCNTTGSCTCAPGQCACPNCPNPSAAFKQSKAKDDEWTIV